MFGTDFMMISKMFPGFSRRHIKLKYTREERMNKERVMTNLQSRERVDLEEFSFLTNKVYEDPGKVKEQMEADEQRLRAEDDARRARDAEQEPAVENEVLLSREQGMAAPADNEGRENTTIERDSSAKENRFASVARSIVQAAMSPKKQRKQNALAKKRDRNKRALEGTEEMVGSIDDVHR